MSTGPIMGEKNKKNGDITHKICFPFNLRWNICNLALASVHPVIPKTEVLSVLIKRKSLKHWINVHREIMKM